jgi:hypothetical protein
MGLSPKEARGVEPTDGDLRHKPEVSPGPAAMMEASVRWVATASEFALRGSARAVVRMPVLGREQVSMWAVRCAAVLNTGTRLRPRSSDRRSR